LKLFLNFRKKDFDPSQHGDIIALVGQVLNINTKELQLMLHHRNVSVYEADYFKGKVGLNAYHKKLKEMPIERATKISKSYLSMLSHVLELAKRCILITQLIYQ